MLTTFPRQPTGEDWWIGLGSTCHFVTVRTQIPGFATAVALFVGSDSAGTVSAIITCAHGRRDAQVSGTAQIGTITQSGRQNAAALAVALTGASVANLPTVLSAGGTSRKSTPLSITGQQPRCQSTDEVLDLAAAAHLRLRFCVRAAVQDGTVRMIAPLCSDSKL